MSAIRGRLITGACALLLAFGFASAWRPPPAPLRSLGMEPVAAADTVTLVTTSDIHYGRATAADAYGHEDAQLALAMNPDYVVPVGDWVDGSESRTQYADKVNPDWGTLKPEFRPTIGNHEYDYPTDYDTYFPPSQRTWGSGNVNNEDYWSWDTSNGWHVASLNMNLSVSEGSAQYNWLAADLAANRGKPTIIFDHSSRYSDGMRGDNSYESAIWALAMQQKADLFISGHDHGYQRWQRLNNSKQADPNGVRQLVVGVGGYGDNSVYGLPYNSSPLREFATVSYHGVIKLTLHLNSYDLEFDRVPSEGGGIVDAVYDQPVLNLREPGPSDTTPPSVPSGLTAAAAGPNSINLAWSASTDNVGVAGYTVYRDGVAAATVGGQVLSYSDGGLKPATTYTYTADAFDAAGNHSAASAAASAKTASAAPAKFVQGATVTTGSLVTAVNLSLKAVAGGDLLVGWFAQYRSAGQVHVSDSANGQWTRAGPSTRYGSGGDIALYYVANSKAAPSGLTVTIASDTATYLAGTADEYSGVATVNPFEVGTAASGSGLTADSGSTAAIPGGELVYGAVTTDNNPGTLSAGAGFTLRTTFDTTAAEDILSGAAGPANARFALTTSTGWHAAVAVFKPQAVDTTPPSEPAGVTAGPSTAGEVDLSWSPSTDDVGVAGYAIYRNSELLATVSGTTLTYTDKTAAGATTYSYTIQAFDGAGNHSALSAAVSVTTLDDIPPSVPAGVAASAVSPTEIDLSWNASTDNVVVSGYTVYRDGAFLATAGAGVTAWADTTVSPSTTHSYTVVAFDAAGNHSTQSTAASATTPALPDTTAPSVPAGLTATATQTPQVNLSWSASTDDVGVSGYTIYRGGQALGTVPVSTLAYADKTAAGLTTYTYTVDAFDTAGNHSAQSRPAVVTTPDWTPPTIPTALSAAVISGGEVDLSWGASTDNVGVSGYTVYRDGVAVGTTAGGTQTYESTGLSHGFTYAFAVDAFDAAGNHSLLSALVSATTPDDLPPTVPGSLTASATSPTAVAVAWSASTDNVGVAGYEVLRDGAVVATTGPGKLNLTDTVVAGSTHAYTVDAFDAAGNHSATAPAVSVTTSTADTAPPTVPTGLSVTALSSSSVGLAWNAAADDVGVTGYTVYRNGAVLTRVGGSTLTHADTGVAPATDYAYTVDAFDAAARHSAQSVAAMVHVPGITKYVQGQVVTTGSRVASLILTFGPVARGDLLVGWFGQYDSTGQVIVSDSVNGTWTRSASTTWRGSSNGPGDIALYYFANSAAAPGGLAITVSAATATYLQVGAAEYSGVATTNPLDKVVIGKGNGSTASSGFTTTAPPGELVYGGLAATRNAGTLTPGASQGVPFVKRAQSSGGTQAQEDIVSSAAGQQQAAFTSTRSVPWFMVCAVFKPA